MAAHQRHGTAVIALAHEPHQLAVLVVGAGQNLLRVRDQRDQVAHLALDLGHRGDQPG